MPAPQNVSVTIRRGEVLAIVGANGSGRSTLAKLLAGLYASAQGSVMWDEVGLATADPEQLWVTAGDAVAGHRPLAGDRAGERHSRPGRRRRPGGAVRREGVGCGRGHRPTVFPLLPAGRQGGEEAVAQPGQAGDFRVDGGEAAVDDVQGRV
ncbi:ATP-binding cassette domain-containing protein [Streptomyces malaysiensis]|uniref:ATP-binding cassette domain-containing protein n=1 Tax=Streptomyces malaysiensis TaxID=92644 RepID=UPI003B5BA7A2